MRKIHFKAVIILAMFYLLAMAGSITACPTLEDEEAALIPATRTLDRTSDPVVVKGSTMSAFLDVPLSQLFIYAYHADSNTWVQIPWQFDEVDSAGEFVSSDDQKLSSSDELAVMAADLGDEATADRWITDLDSRNYARCGVTVTDPLQPQKQGWFYVFRSATLTKTVTTDYANSTGLLISTGRYKHGLVDKTLLTNRLELNNNGQNILDRTKVRLVIPQGTATENDLDFGRWRLIRDGQVRTITTYNIGQLTSLTLLNYSATFVMHVTADFSLLEVSSFDQFRFSVDLSPAMSGSTYYDANTSGGEPVNGVPDTVPATPLSLWNQVSHPTLGSIIQAFDISSLGGSSPQTYYKDNATVDASDTGDGKSYCDCGVTVANTSSNLVFSVWYYVFQPNQPNIGATYFAYAHNPLQAQGTAITFGGQFSPYDVNRDGNVDQQDATVLAGFLSGDVKSLSSGGDVNVDGITNSADLARLLVKLTLGV